jgi:signal transduction histidine kinase
VTRSLEVDDGGHELVIADSAALEQILGILLDNANRYAPTGRIRVRIEPAFAASMASPGAEASSATQASPDGDGQGLVRIVVEDEGPGVSPAERERIFRRFVRGSTSGASEGMGLGLGVARGLARAMGGELRYVPGELGGAGFVLTLPGAIHDEAADLEQRSVTSGLAGMPAGRR